MKKRGTVADPGPQDRDGQGSLQAEHPVTKLTTGRATAAVCILMDRLRWRGSGAKTGAFSLAEITHARAEKRASSEAIQRRAVLESPGAHLGAECASGTGQRSYPTNNPNSREETQSPPRRKEHNFLRGRRRAVCGVGRCGLCIEQVGAALQPQMEQLRRLCNPTPEDLGPVIADFLQQVTLSALLTCSPRAAWADARIHRRPLH